MLREIKMLYLVSGILVYILLLSGCKTVSSSMKSDDSCSNWQEVYEDLLSKKMKIIFNKADHDENYPQKKPIYPIAVSYSSSQLPIT